MPREYMAGYQVRNTEYLWKFIMLSYFGDRKYLIGLNW